MKFHVCSDLARACKISVQDLLRHASHKIYGCITQLMMLNPDVLKIIAKYLSLKFFQNEVLHKSWYYLLVNKLINFELLETRILSLTLGGELNDKNCLFKLDDLKSRLHDLIARIALSDQSKKDHPDKKTLL